MRNETRDVRSRLLDARRIESVGRHGYRVCWTPGDSSLLNALKHVRSRGAQRSFGGLRLHRSSQRNVATRYRRRRVTGLELMWTQK